MLNFCDKKLAININIIICLFLIITLAPFFEANTHIWYIPHPDDETIGMAGAIHNSVLEGNENIVVFLTQGKASKVRRKIKVSKEIFGEARLVESLEALTILGVSPENVYVYDYLDGKLKLNEARGVISDFIKRFPNSVHNTVSVFDPHRDHQTLARALYREYLESEKVLAVNFYRVYIYRQPFNKRVSPFVETIPVRNLSIKRRALESFTIWDPDNGFYSIGQQSVPDLIAAAKVSPYEYRDKLVKKSEFWLKHNIYIVPKTVFLPFAAYYLVNTIFRKAS